MPDFNKFEEYVYKAIVELTRISPDGELTYTKILTCFLNGQANKDIPWEAIQKSKIYGKFPKANLLTVMMACNKLADNGYLKKVKVGGNYKYFLTSSKLGENDEPKSFSERIHKYKKYLLIQFAEYLVKVCPSLKGVEHEKYYGFINKNPIHFNEYNWIWVTDESREPNSLKVFVRYRPNLKRIASELILSQDSFFDVVDEIVDILRDEKSKYKLVLNKNIERPVIQGPAVSKKPVDSAMEIEQVDLSFFAEESFIFFNDGSEEAVNAALSTSESSPYKYSGDTLFAPKDLKKTVQGKKSFEFSFIKWKVAAWTINDDEPSYIQNVLLVSKKTKNAWIVISVPKRKVVCITTCDFKIETEKGSYSSNDILEIVFDNKAN